MLGEYKGKEVAVKFVSVSAIEDGPGPSKAIATLVREAQTLKDLHDDNIVNFQGASILVSVPKLLP